MKNKDIPTMKLEGTHAFGALEEIGSMKLNGLLHPSEIGWGGGHGETPKTRT